MYFEVRLFCSVQVITVGMPGGETLTPSIESDAEKQIARDVGGIARGMI